MKENETSWIVTAITVLGIIIKWKPIAEFGEKLATRWLEGRLPRQLSRRVSDAEMAEILASELEGRETLVLMMQSEWQADRVTVVEYDCPTDGPTLATCSIEAREAHMPSVRASLQRTPVEPEVWSEIQRVHGLPLRYLFVPDVRKLEIVSLRSQLIRSGVRSAYYQSLPATRGHCGAMLSLSWSTAVELTDEDLAGLHFSARALADVSRSCWALQRVAA